jgi:2-keto-4-pentenoate hydratase/2-oxohepta-3-ene-1,7-dioic acid hydratase in catechol pathway
VIRRAPWLLAAALASGASSPSTGGGSDLAPLDAAFTLAFAARDGTRSAYLVAALEGEAVEAVALGAGDPFEALGARSDAANEAWAQEAPRVRLALAELLPVLEGARHVAAGANYPEHGAEVNVDAPFLFPKIAAPDPPRQRLAAEPGWLLDYEVEIAVVFDRDVAGEADLRAARAGVFLANDFTERAQLVREADLSGAGVGVGFANAKGKPGFFPTGPFLVVPRDWRAFVRDCEIRLAVNGDERQRARGREMIWEVDEIVRRALALAGRPRFEHEGRGLALVDVPLPRGTALLTGTPGGVVFAPPGRAFVLAQLARWLFGLHFWSEGAVDFVKRSYVDELLRAGRFLQPGDFVVAEGAGLGSIETYVEPVSR